MGEIIISNLRRYGFYWHEVTENYEYHASDAEVRRRIRKIFDSGAPCELCPEFSTVFKDVKIATFWRDSLGYDITVRHGRETYAMRLSEEEKDEWLRKEMRQDYQEGGE